MENHMNIVLKIRDKFQVLISHAVKTVYEAYMRKRLKNRDFTILCPNCIGGMIYHRLGLPFRSPTINLWMRQRDFLSFAANPRAYISQPLQFVDSDMEYPVAKLRDITIYFNHSNSCEEASADWYRRMQRINYDNIFLIMYDIEDITKEDILRFESIPCRGRLVLSDRHYPDIPYVKTIHPTERLFGKQFIDQDWLGLKTFEKHLDFVKWLNQGN